jgi:hypothetical protein
VASVSYPFHFATMHYCLLSLVAVFISYLETLYELQQLLILEWDRTYIRSNLWLRIEAFKGHFEVPSRSKPCDTWIRRAGAAAETRTGSLPNKCHIEIIQVAIFGLRNVSRDHAAYIFIAMKLQPNQTKPNQTNQPTPWSRVLLEKLTVTQPVKKYPAVYGTRRFITVFIRAHHWSLSWARRIQSTLSHPLFLKSILLSSSHIRLGLLSDLFPLGFPTVKTSSLG